MKNLFTGNLLYRFCSELIPSPQQGTYIKLSKLISNKSVCSRREADRIIQLGLVRIDGKRIYNNVLVAVNSDLRTLSPTGIVKQQPIMKLWMINKPRGYICTHQDPQNRPTVYSLLPPQFSKFGTIQSVGRLDYNSEGLLLLTNNSMIKNLLQNPQAKMLRYYRVKVHGRLTPEKLSSMHSVINIKGQQYGPLKVTVDRELTTNSWLKVSMLTGKNRQIRKIMQKNDLQVNKLIRQQYGSYKMGKLKHGQLKELEISPGLFKRAELGIAQKFSEGTKSFIEIDIRKEAIDYAKKEQQKLKDAREPAKQIQE